MPSKLFESKRHDTAISLPLTLTPPPGVTWNLQTAGTVVRLIARLPGANSHKIRGTCRVTGTWTCEYDPLPADVDTIGLYDVEVEVTLSNTKKVTFPTKDPASVTPNPDALQWRIGTDLDNQ